MSKDKSKKTKELSIPGRGRTNAIMNLANITDAADGQIFPAVYKNVQDEFAARTPSQTLGFASLGLITASRSILQSVSTPLWGWWSDRHSRKKILAIGCWFWAIFTMLTALSVGYVDMLLWRTVTGIGLAAIIPTTGSLVTDYFSPEKRGRAFGVLGLTGGMGALIGTLFMTLSIPEDPHVLIYGMVGWRFGFIVVAIATVIIGVLVWALVKDPLRGGLEPELTKILTAQKAERYKVKRSDYIKILKKRTFVMIMLQGVAGTIPWSGSILWMIAWFEIIGFSAPVAGIMFLFLAIGGSTGVAFGGWIGDRAARWRPNSGRIIVAQISVLTGIILSFVIFMLIPRTTDSFSLYTLFGFIMGLLITWAGPANNAIFSEIFEPEIRGSVFSVDRVFEGSVGAAGTLLVGLFADYLLTSGAPNAATALGNSMFAIAVIPWIACLILYSLVYKSYPKDKATLRQTMENRRKELEK
ncbi:MAG: MFS transporter [Candidatus Atabeyarchaeum deiterrae]